MAQILNMSIFIAFHVNNNMKVLVIIAIQLFDLQNLQCEFDTFNWLQIRYIHTLIYTNFLCLFFRQVPIQQEDTKSSSGCCCRFIAWVSFAHLKVCMDEQSLSDQTPNRGKPVASAIKHTKKKTRKEGCLIAGATSFLDLESQSEHSD